MVGALNVDGLGEAALELGKVVGDVGHKVGKGAVDLAHHAVLVVVNAEVFAFGGLEPEGAVAFFGAAGVDHGLHGGLHAAGGVERGLEVEVVEVYAERIKVVVLLVAQIGDAVATDAVGVGKVALGFDDRAVMRMHGLAVKVVAGDGDHVFAVIGVFRKFDGFTLELAGAQADGFGEIADLNAGVVVVELAGDFPALSGEKIGKHVSEGALTGVAEMKRAGRVGGHELKKNGLVLVGVAAAEGRAGLEDLTDDFLAGVVLNAEVDEAGAGDFDRLDESFAFGVGLEGLDDLRGDLARVLLEGASELHGDRTGDVAVFGHLRAFENDGDAGDAERFERGGNEGGQSLFLLSEHDECRVSDGFVFLIVTVYLFGSEDTSERDRENVTACRPFRQQADAVNVSVPGGHQRLSCVM